MLKSLQFSQGMSWMNFSQRGTLAIHYNSTNLTTSGRKVPCAVCFNALESRRTSKKRQETFRQFRVLCSDNKVNMGLLS